MTGDDSVQEESVCFPSVSVKSWPIVWVCVSVFVYIFALLGEVTSPVWLQAQRNHSGYNDRVMALCHVRLFGAESHALQELRVCRETRVGEQTPEVIK